MKSVIFLAPPASGKGTLSEYLINRFHYKHLSTGDLLREKASQDEKLQKILESGKLVDDETILNILEEALASLPKNVPFILDGVPRTLQQAKKLDIILSGLGVSNVIVVSIDVQKEILIDRVIGRKVCPTCHRSYNVNSKQFQPKVPDICDDCLSNLVTREDDNLESFMVRYQTYLESTYPIIAYYKKKGCLKVIQNNELDQTEALNKLWGALK